MVVTSRAPMAARASRWVAIVRRAGRRIVHLDAVVAGDDGTEYVLASGVFAVIAAR